MGKKKKNKFVVYSTNPEFEELDEFYESETLLPEEQNLRVLLDRKKRGGKTVTLIIGFTGTENDLKTLGKELKTSCGVGGTVKDGEIIIQGEVREKVLNLLHEKGYNAKKSGG